MKAIDFMIKITIEKAIIEIFITGKVPGDFVADLKRSLLEPKQTETSYSRLRTALDILPISLLKY